MTMHPVNTTQILPKAEEKTPHQTLKKKTQQSATRAPEPDDQREPPALRGALTADSNPLQTAFKALGHVWGNIEDAAAHNHAKAEAGRQLEALHHAVRNGRIARNPDNARRIFETAVAKISANDALTEAERQRYYRLMTRQIMNAAERSLNDRACSILEQAANGTQVGGRGVGQLVAEMRAQRQVPPEERNDPELTPEDLQWLADPANYEAPLRAIREREMKALAALQRYTQNPDLAAKNERGQLLFEGRYEVQAFDDTPHLKDPQPYAALAYTVKDTQGDTVVAMMGNSEAWVIREDGPGFKHRYRKFLNETERGYFTEAGHPVFAAEAQYTSGDLAWDAFVGINIALQFAGLGAAKVNAARTRALQAKDARLSGFTHVHKDAAGKISITQNQNGTVSRYQHVETAPRSSQKRQQPLRPSNIKERVGTPPQTLLVEHPEPTINLSPGGSRRNRQTGTDLTNRGGSTLSTIPDSDSKSLTEPLINAAKRLPSAFTNAALTRNPSTPMVPRQNSVNTLDPSPVRGPGQILAELQQGRKKLDALATKVEDGNKQYVRMSEYDMRFQSTVLLQDAFYNDQVRLSYELAESLLPHDALGGVPLQNHSLKVRSKALKQASKAHPDEVLFVEGINGGPPIPIKNGAYDSDFDHKLGQVDPVRWPREFMTPEETEAHEQMAQTRYAFTNPEEMGRQFEREFLDRLKNRANARSQLEKGVRGALERKQGLVRQELGPDGSLSATWRFKTTDADTVATGTLTVDASTGHVQFAVTQDGSEAPTSVESAPGLYLLGPQAWRNFPESAARLDGTEQANHGNFVSALRDALKKKQALPAGNTADGASPPKPGALSTDVANSQLKAVLKGTEFQNRLEQREVEHPRLLQELSKLWNAKTGDAQWEGSDTRALLWNVPVPSLKQMYPKQVSRIDSWLKIRGKTEASTLSVRFSVSPQGSIVLQPEALSTHYAETGRRYFLSEYDSLQFEPQVIGAFNKLAASQNRSLFKGVRKVLGDDNTNTFIGGVTEEQLW